MMKFNLFVLVGALAVATATAGKSIICADDPNYVSSLGLSCEHHIQVDCHAFAHVGMPPQEADELLQRCPNSCRVDGCSSNERTGSLRISDKGALAMAPRSLEGKIDRGANIAADSADVFSRSLEGDTCFGGKCKDDPQVLIGDSGHAAECAAGGALARQGSRGIHARGARAKE